MVCGASILTLDSLLHRSSECPNRRCVQENTRTTWAQVRLRRKLTHTWGLRLTFSAVLTMRRELTTIFKRCEIDEVCKKTLEPHGLKFDYGDS